MGSWSQPHLHLMGGLGKVSHFSEPQTPYLQNGHSDRPGSRVVGGRSWHRTGGAPSLPACPPGVLSQHQRVLSFPFLHTPGGGGQVHRSGLSAPFTGGETKAGEFPEVPWGAELRSGPGSGFWELAPAACADTCALRRGDSSPAPGAPDACTGPGPVPRLPRLEPRGPSPGARRWFAAAQPVRKEHLALFAVAQIITMHNFMTNTAYKTQHNYFYNVVLEVKNSN